MVSSTTEPTDARPSKEPWHWNAQRRRVASAVAILFVGCAHPGAGAQAPPATPETIAKVHDPAALQADLDAIVELHERRCPDPYLRTSREEIAALLDRLKRRIDHPMSRREFIRFVMELQAAYGIDHMAMMPPQEDLLAWLRSGGRVVPFRAAPRGDELEIVAVSDGVMELQPGDRILSINGRSARDHLAELRSLVPGENERFQARRLRDFARQLEWALGTSLPVTLEIRRSDGTSGTVVVEGVGAAAGRNERTTAAPQAVSKARAEVLVDEPPFRCSLLDGTVALIDFPTMNQSLAARWQTFLDHAFDAMKTRGATALIVDVRRNGGGDSRLGDQLLSRITGTPYRQCAGVVIGSFASGDLERQGAPPRPQPRRAPGFDGPSFLLIGEGTFSSAEMLADAARTYDLMVTIGEPTGGVPSSLGELGSFELPASRLKVPFCTKRFIRANGDENDPGPVRPHIEVPPADDRDTALERALAEIRARSPAP